MIDMQPQFVSAEDFLNYWGVDLRKELKGDGDESFKADRFLRKIEDRLMTWIDANTFRVTPWDYYKDDFVPKNDWQKKFVNEQKDYWRKAILTQAMYVFRNSDIGMDSGYDPEKGIIAPETDLQAIEICRPCIDYLKSAGLYNHVVKNRPRYTSFD